MPQTRGNQRDEARAKNAKSAAGKGLSSKDQKSVDGLSVTQVRSLLSLRWLLRHLNHQKYPAPLYSPTLQRAARDAAALKEKQDKKAAEKAAAGN